MSSWLSIAVALITGAFVLVGYFVQKRLEHKQGLADRRREAYAQYLRTVFENMERRRRHEPDDVAAEVYWRTQVLLYATDDTIRVLGEFLDVLVPKERSESQSGEGKAKLDTMLLAMRRETVKGTATSLDEIRRCSPLIE